MNGPKMDHFFATKFYIHFSGNPQSNGWISIFAGSKTLQKVIKITHFDVLQGPFIHRDQASRRASKILQNDVKMHLKSPQNEHEKVSHPVLQWSKTHTVAWPPNTHEHAFIFVVPGVALFTPWMQKSLKIVQNSPQNDHKKIRRRVSQWLKPHAVAWPAKMHHNAFIFVFPGVALLMPWIEKALKIGGNRWWVHFKVSTVGPAARRANSKCI